MNAGLGLNRVHFSTVALDPLKKHTFFLLFLFLDSQSLVGLSLHENSIKKCILLGLLRYSRRSLCRVSDWGCFPLWNGGVKKYGSINPSSSLFKNLDFKNRSRISMEWYVCPYVCPPLNLKNKISGLVLMTWASRTWNYSTWSTINTNNYLNRLLKRICCLKSVRLVF